VSRNLLEVVVLGDKVGVGSSLLDQGGDVGGGDVHAWADKAQRRGERATLGYNSTDASRQCFYWTKPARTGSVVDCSATLSILLVIHPEGDRSGA
jgi:hypothetical protein